MPIFNSHVHLFTSTKMGKKKSNKFNSGKWKPVKIDGCLAVEGLDGLAGFEVLENYNPSFLSGEIKGRNKEYLSNELDGDVFSCSTKRKASKDSDDEVEEEKADSESDTGVREQPKKKKLKKTNLNHFPGKFVLLKPSADDDSANSEHSDVRSAWNAIGITSNEIIKALIENNFKTPTEIQRLTIAASAYGKFDIVAASETGSGKSLAFLLPIIQNIQKRLNDNDEESDELFSLILTPTREVKKLSAFKS